MKRILYFFVVVALVLALLTPAYASATIEGDSSPESENPSETITDTTVLVPDVNVFNQITVEGTDDLGEYVGTSVYSLNPVQPSDTNGLKAVMLSLIGDWDSIIVEHSYENTNGYISYVREIQLDYPWLCSCAIFLVVLFCILRGGFAVLCKK